MQHMPQYYFTFFSRLYFKIKHSIFKSGLRYKARCVQGPQLTHEGVEILFDPTQKASVCQVKPAQNNTGMDASIYFLASLSTIPFSTQLYWEIEIYFVHGIIFLTVDFTNRIEYTHITVINFFLCELGIINSCTCCIAYKVKNNNALT